MKHAPITLFCLPCAGASAITYLRWRRRLPVWVHVEPVELPGRGERRDEPSEEAFDALVARLCDEFAPKLPRRYALFGHSMGALLAHGVAHGLRVRRVPMPSALLVSGCAAPSRRDRERFAAKQDDAALIADLRRQGGTPEELFANPELLRMTLGLLGADYRVCESFRHRDEPKLCLPIHVFAGRDDDIQASRLTAWQREGTAEFSLDWFDGGHFFLRQHEEAFLSFLVRRLAGDHAEVADAAIASA